MQTSWMILLGIGSLVVAGLAVYAVTLLYRLKAQKVQQLQQQNSAINARKERITESVQIIAAAMQREECELSEGAIRIVKLLAAIPSAQPQNWLTIYPNLHAFYAEIQDMPIMDARAALAKQERMQLDLNRFRFESEYVDCVQPEIELLTAFQCE